MGAYKKIKNWFVEHPSSISETYFEHMLYCIKISASLLKTAAILLLHGLFPFLYVKTGSLRINNINKEIQGRLLNGKDKSECTDSNKGW